MVQFFTVILSVRVHFKSKRIKVLKTTVYKCNSCFVFALSNNFWVIMTQSDRGRSHRDNELLTSVIKAVKQIRVILCVAPLSARAAGQTVHVLTLFRHQRNHMGETLGNAQAKTEAASQVQSIQPAKTPPSAPGFLRRVPLLFTVSLLSMSWMDARLSP